jgi:hypothetical protein
MKWVMPSRSGLVVTLLLGSLLAGCTSSRTDDAGGQSPGPSIEPAQEPSIEPPSVPSGPELPGQVISLDLADEHHGFALLADCEEGLPFGARDCAYHVAVLDGGQEWRLRQAPLPQEGLDELGFVIEAAAPGHALLYGVPGDDAEETAWRTTDGGRSWQEGAVEATGSVAGIPEGALVTTAADDQLAVLMPGSARYRTLAAQPPLSELGRPGRLPDGRVWVAGLDRASGEPAIAVSREEGRGWRTLAPLPTAAPFPGSVSHRELLLAEGPDGLYAFESGLVAGAEYGSGTRTSTYDGRLLGIHHSGDGGRSWRRVWTRTGDDDRPGSVFGTPIAAADGSLLVYADDAIYVSDDGGRSFTVQRVGPPPEEPEVTRAGYLLTDLDHPGHYRISADGFSWYTIVLGNEES